MYANLIRPLSLFKTDKNSSRAKPQRSNNHEFPNLWNIQRFEYPEMEIMQATTFLSLPTLIGGANKKSLFHSTLLVWSLTYLLFYPQAWKLGMHGGDYAWILPDETIDLSGMTGDWYTPGPNGCSSSQLTQTLNGVIIVKSHGTALPEETSSSGLVRDFQFFF